MLKDCIIQKNTNIKIKETEKGIIIKLEYVDESKNILYFPSISTEC